MTEFSPFGSQWRRLPFIWFWDLVQWSDIFRRRSAINEAGQEYAGLQELPGSGLYQQGGKPAQVHLCTSQTQQKELLITHFHLSPTTGSHIHTPVGCVTYMYAGDFNNKVINHISWMKVVMKVCLSEMYLSFMYISCHYYCVIVRIFKNILYQSIARSMCSYIVYSLRYNHCIISLLPPF